MFPELSLSKLRKQLSQSVTYLSIQIMSLTWLKYHYLLPKLLEFLIFDGTGPITVKHVDLKLLVNETNLGACKYLQTNGLFLDWKASMFHCLVQTVIQWHLCVQIGLYQLERKSIQKSKFHSQLQSMVLRWLTFWRVRSSSIWCGAAIWDSAKMLDGCWTYPEKWSLGLVVVWPTYQILK